MGCAPDHPLPCCPRDWEGGQDPNLITVAQTRRGCRPLLAPAKLSLGARRRRRTPQEGLFRADAVNEEDPERDDDEEEEEEEEEEGLLKATAVKEYHDLALRVPTGSGTCLVAAKKSPLNPSYLRLPLRLPV